MNNKPIRRSIYPDVVGGTDLLSLESPKASQLTFYRSIHESPWQPRVSFIDLLCVIFPIQLPQPPSSQDTLGRVQFCSQAILV